MGGGIRTYEQIEGLLSLGVSQVILGSAAIYDPQLVERANRDFPHKIVVGIDAKMAMQPLMDGKKDSNLTAEALARRVAAAGTERIIFTDISRDGMMNGSNIEATAALYQACGVPITASGGVSSLEDIRRLKARETDGIEGCIIGKALYAGAFSLSDAPQDCRGGVTMLAKESFLVLMSRQAALSRERISSSSATPVIPWSLQPNMNGSRPMN